MLTIFAALAAVRSGRSALLDSPASTEGKRPPRSLPSLPPPQGRSALLGRPGEYRRKKTPRCLPGCL
ncbi:hypothetical protein DF157_20630 [Burkholderia cenocepacia]|nr:hypothetical protein DF157_20630 [Burkholderia cenocepacia]RQV39210.1 hypothetical protein DF027_21760 [Burkholderia cenocepacia]RQV41274.1 hypothetical protein DF028_14655 [Burkholderia cenocepacia]RQV78130.1 hypothetical protein DF010_15060 [Burkholderia cenocepacia]